MSVEPQLVAALHGHRDILEHIIEHDADGSLSQYVMAAAAQGGHFELVKWLHERLKFPIKEVPITASDFSRCKLACD